MRRPTTARKANLRVVASEGKPVAPEALIQITPPNIRKATINLVSTAPYVQNAMSSETRKKIVDKQQQGSVGKKKRNLPPKDFDKIYRGMMHVATAGWYGMPCNALRAGMISACRVVGYPMTRAKLGIIGVEPDGYSKDGTPLVKLLTGKPVRRDLPVKLADGSTDILPRPFFNTWSAKISVEWDADMFSVEEIVNLVARFGRQVGIGAGRPDSKQSTGMGWGTFRVKA